MKKIINGKKYDTETATLICGFYRGYPTDFAHVYEDLYRKKTGEFFIYGEGGARSKYAQRTGNLWCSGKAITPLSEKEAKSFIEKHGTAEDYEKCFGEVEE